MTSPVLALRAAILACCAADAALALLMGATPAIHDEPPPGEPDLYALFGDATARDWSTSSDRGHDQDLAISVWSAPGRAAATLAVAERMAELLDEADLALAGHHLVRLQVTAVATVRDRDTNLVQAEIRLRALTEVSP